MNLTDAARDVLVERGYDPNYGARPLKRVIQRLILDPLAMKLLEGEFSESKEVIVDASNGEITFRSAVPATYH